MNLANLHPSRPTEALLNRAHFHESCGSLMSTVRINLTKHKVLGGEGEYPGPAVLHCPL